MAEAAQIQSCLNESRSSHCCFEYTRHPAAACSSQVTPKANKFPPCYIITMAGISTLVGSGATAIFSSVYWSDVAGGFAIGQYILGVGAIAITCVLQIHGKTCACWTTAQSGKICAHVALECPYHGDLLWSSASMASPTHHIQAEITY